MPRTLKDGWLQTYKKYIIKHEAPPIFHFWVGMTMVSASLRRRVWIDRGAYNIYPNQYVILLAESATCRKSVAMEIGLELLRQNEEIKVVNERTTLEGLMDVMNRVVIDVSKGGVRPDASITLHADELSNLFGKASYITDLVSFLTSAYTSRAGTMDFLTRNKAWVKVKEPCPVILAGTTPEQLGEIFPVMSLLSGFFGRVLLIVGSRSERVAKPKLDVKLKPKLVDDLYHISQLSGEVKPTDECEEFYTRWYEQLTEPFIPELSPFFERKHDHVWKTAMLLSLSKSDSKVITLEDFQVALEEIEHVERNIPRATSFVGATAKSTLGDLIVRMVSRSSPEPLSHTLILKRVYKKIDDRDEFNKIMDTLVESKRLKRTGTSTSILYHTGDSE